MNLNFTKMHGTGNDFIVIDCIKINLPSPKKLAITYCNRAFGIGADQMLLIMPSSKADFKMLIFNADGSEVEMCGNGIRCIARYVVDRGLTEKDRLSIETLAGIIYPEVIDDYVNVDMGEPVLEGRYIPVNRDGIIKSYELSILDKTFSINAVSMGNPHCIIFTDDVKSIDLLKYGPLIETNSLFPKRTNVEFVEVVKRDEIRVKVWERGSGITMSCGTGACASVVAAILNNKTARNVTTHMDGGDLKIQWSEKDNKVIMSGHAVFVYDGVVCIEPV